MRDLCAERSADLVTESPQDRRLEHAGRDGHHPNLPGGQFAGERQREGYYAALGRRVGGLADLAVEGCDGRGVDDDTALTLDRLGGSHRSRGESGHVERAHEVDVDDAAEPFEVERT